MASSTKGIVNPRTQFNTKSFQHFYTLREECLANGTLFEDPEFPAIDSSVYFKQKPKKGFEWKRPYEIVNNPEFVVEGFSRFDVKQGELLNCWWVAAAANLTLYRGLFHQIVPDDQGFVDKYAGIFHFRFWQYNHWIDVVVDDRLPTRNDRLIYLRSSEKNEFWSPLLEKAYAKIHGSYEALALGSTSDAMQDFTGGLAELYNLKSSPNLLQIMLKAYERSSLLACFIIADPNITEALTKEGLVKGHAYSITKIRYVDIQKLNSAEKIPLLRIRNPWGNEVEWNGAWSDGAPEWKLVSEAEKQSLGLTFEHDGEFWMSFEDFVHYFEYLDICNLDPHCTIDEKLCANKKWEVSIFEGEWVRGVSTGGCRAHLNTFWRNPQYRITITDVDEGEQETECTMIVALMQKNRRLLRNIGGDSHNIGFSVYNLPNPDQASKPLYMTFFRDNPPVSNLPKFTKSREVNYRFKLPPGTYCIVPSTFQPNEEAEFLLRVFTEQMNIMEENDEAIGYEEIDMKLGAQGSTPQKVNLQVSSASGIIESVNVHETFSTIAGKDGEIEWMELKYILDQAMKAELSKNTFSKDICRSMVALLDTDHCGKLNFKQFQELWILLCKWKKAWILHDTDKSGTFSGFELREALNAAGYRLNTRILNVLMHRYGNKGEINFDDFIMCAIKLKTMIDIFTMKDETRANAATFKLEEWLLCTLYS